MSAAHSYMSTCPDIQHELINHFETCNAANLREPMPFFDTLYSGFNRNNLQQVVVDGPGKIKNVILRYDQRILESSVTKPGSCDRSCTATNRRGDLTSTYTIDPCDYYEESEIVKTQDFYYTCQSNPEIIAGKIQRMIDVVIRKIATDVVSQASSLKGKWSSLITSSTTPPIGTGADLNLLILKTLKSVSSGDINPLAWNDLSGALMQTNFCNMPMIFSGMTLFKYAQLMNAACCSAQGLDLAAISAQYGLAVAYDKRVEAAIGGTGAWALSPGALQIITYNEAPAYNEMAAAAGVGVGTNHREMLIVDPATGFPIDLTISDNCGKVSIFVRANAKVVSVPTDLYAPSDEMAGVTGFAGIEVQNT